MLRELLQFPHFLGLGIIASCGFSYFIVARYFPVAGRSIRRAANCWSVPFIILMGALVLIFGSLGFGLKEGRRAESVPLALYETFQIYAFNIDPEKLNGTRFPETEFLQTAMICAILLYSTIVAQGIWLLFRKSYVEMQLQFVSGHIVICGLGRIGRQLIEDLLKRKDRRTIVIIEPDANNIHLEWAHEYGALTIIGDATKSESLEAAQIHRASEIFVVTGKDECNIECVIELRDIIRRKRRHSFDGPKKLRCQVHILDRDLAEIVRTKAGKLESSTDELDSGYQLDIEIFNALERTARRLLEDIATAKNKKQEHICPNKDEVAHLILLGFGEFGQTLALKLAELAHFENGKRLRMTIVDRDIKKKAREFIARHPAFGPDLREIKSWNFNEAADDWHDKTYRPIAAARLPDESPGIEYVCNVQYLEYTEATEAVFLTGLKKCRTDKVKPIVLVCFEDDRQNFAIAERLRAKLETQLVHLPIFVWIPRQRELSQMLDNRNTEIKSAAPDSNDECQLIPFGQCYGSVSYSEITGSWNDWLARQLPLIWLPDDHKLAAQVSGLNAALKAADPTKALAALNWDALDEVAKSYWEECSEWERASNRSAAIHAVLKAAAVGYSIVDVSNSEERTPISITADLEERLRRMEHYRWVAERLIGGWKYDPERVDREKKRWQITSWDGLANPPAAEIERAAKKNKPLNEKMKDEKIVKLVLELIKIGRLQVKPIP